jgi:hypothetical protein
MEEWSIIQHALPLSKYQMVASLVGVEREEKDADIADTWFSCFLPS